MVPLARPLSVSQTWHRYSLPACVCVLVLVGGFLRTVPGAAIVDPTEYRRWSFAHIAYSDVIALHDDRGAREHRLPYVEDRIEYPVLLGLAMWVPSQIAPGPFGYFVVSYIGLAVCALGMLWILCALPQTQPWAWAASPALLAYAGLNWDLSAILLLGTGIWLWAYGKHHAAAALLALAVWTKFFPVLVLAVFLLSSLRRGWRECLELVGIVLLVTVVVNSPFALGSETTQTNWSWFFRYNSQREIERSLYLVFGVHPRRFTPQANAISAEVMLVALAVLAAVEIGTRRVRPLHAAVALLSLFFFMNKVFTVQYWLWVVAILALVQPPGWLAATVGLMSLVDFGITFGELHLSAEGQAAYGWYYQEVFIPGLILRYGTLALCFFWAASQCVAPAATGAGTVPKAEDGHEGALAVGAGARGSAGDGWCAGNDSCP